MQTSLRVLEYLAQCSGPQMAKDVGYVIWPALNESKGQEAAMGILGRLRKRGLVSRTPGPSGYPSDTYSVTQDGFFVLKSKTALKGADFKAAATDHVRRLNQWAMLLKSVGQVEGARHLQEAAEFIEEVQASRLTTPTGALAPRRIG